MLSLRVAVLMLLMAGAQCTNMVQCPLCATAATIPVRLSYQVSSTQTCLDVYLALGKLNSTDPTCSNQQALYRNVCCNATQPASLTNHPTSAPVYTGPVGSQPNCPICGTLEYPGIPSAFIVARYVGSYSCAQLYDLGLHGLIPSNMCTPLQLYAEKVCGCGAYNPKCQADPAACWGYSPASTASKTYPRRSFHRNGGRSIQGNRRTVAEDNLKQEHDESPPDSPHLRGLLIDAGV